MSTTIKELVLLVKENEIKEYFKEHKILLQREHEELQTLKASKKRLKTIQESIKRNNNWYRLQ